jgi:hypothetical protein
MKDGQIQFRYSVEDHDADALYDLPGFKRSCFAMRAIHIATL